MSDIQLSPKLFQDIQQAVISQEPEAAKDAGLMMQYVGAVLGYILGSQTMQVEHKREFLQELNGFIAHVMEDTTEKSQPKTPPQAPAANAFGYWNPPKK
jgi:hypothetical protein